MHGAQDASRPARAEAPPLAASRPGEQSSAWLERLQSIPSDLRPAFGMYAGIHWRTVCQIHADALRSGAEIRVLVCSAGYGLVAWDAPLKPYNATFTPGHADSVCPAGIEDRQWTPAWWDHLGAWPGPTPGSPRSLTELAADSGAVVVVAGPHYLHAMSADLMRGLVGRDSPERYVIVSAGQSGLSRPTNPLGMYFLTCDARWEHRFPVARTGLSAAVAAELLRRAGYRASGLSEARSALERELELLPPVRTFDRKPLSDDEVLEYIRARLTDDHRLSFTALLRELRDAGFACEYKRFRALHVSAQRGLHATT